MSRRSRRICSLLVLVLFPAVLALAQSTQLIPWDADALLAWEDFQGVPPANAAQLSEVGAIHMTVKWHASYTVQSQRGNRYSWVGTMRDVIVSNLMNPRFSWVLSSKATPAGLHHEQLHFDLNEVYRRKLSEALSALRVEGSTAEATMGDLDARIKRTADDLLDRLTDMQDRYDLETSHSIDAVAQAEWENDIRVWLASPALAP